MSVVVGAAVVGGIALGSMGSDGPDTSGMNAAAQQQAALSKEQLDWSKEIYKDTAPQREKASQIALEQSQLQTDAARKSLALGDETAARYRTTFQPLEDKMVSDAAGYDTPARREAAARAAVADSEIALTNQRQATMQDMERHGVNPSSGRMMAMQGTMDLGAAKMKAGAANTARQQVATMGAAKLSDSVNLGRGIATSNATNTQLGVQAGTAGVNSATVPMQQTAAGASLMNSGYSGAQQGLVGAGSLYGNIAGIQQRSDASNQQAMAGLGQAAAMYFSDEGIKHDREPVDTGSALAAARKMPVERWKYDVDSAADDGGKEHIGPMAQDANAAGGDSLAPGGTMIDMISMHGITLGSVQELDKRMKRIEKKLNTPTGAKGSARNTNARSA